MLLPELPVALTFIPYRALFALLVGEAEEFHFPNAVATFQFWTVRLARYGAGCGAPLTSVVFLSNASSSARAATLSRSRGPLRRHTSSTPPLWASRPLRTSLPATSGRKPCNSATRASTLPAASPPRTRRRATGPCVGCLVVSLVRLILLVGVDFHDNAARHPRHFRHAHGVFGGDRRMCWVWFVY